jgi:hypothetical protein
MFGHRYELQRVEEAYLRKLEGFKPSPWLSPYFRELGKQQLRQEAFEGVNYPKRYGSLSELEQLAHEETQRVLRESLEEDLRRLRG